MSDGLILKYNTKLIKKISFNNFIFERVFNIKILYHNGAYFCKFCNKVILKGSCKHNHYELEEVSGSKLRNCLKTNKPYEYASKDIQDWSKENIKTLY